MIKREGTEMSSYNHCSYVPIALTCNVIPFENELVLLQEQRLRQKKASLPGRLTSGVYSNGLFTQNAENDLYEINKPR
jgi:hypothetical protein